MCRRTTTDPLLSIFAREDYTLLRNMRTGVDVLDTWVDFTGVGPFKPVGALPDLFDGGLSVPRPATAGRTDVERERTAAMEASLALDFLAPFFATVGIAALTKLRTRLASKKGTRVHVTVAGVTERSISLARLSRDLGASQIAANQGKLLTDGRRVAFAAQVIRATSVYIETLKKSGGEFDLGAGLVLAADLNTGASFDQVSRSVLSFSSPDPIAFGVRLYELQLDVERRTARLESVQDYDVLGGTDALARPGGKPVGRDAPLVIDGQDGSLFAEI